MTEERSVIDEVAPSACERMTCSVNIYIITYEKTANTNRLASLDVLRGLDLWLLNLEFRSFLKV